MQCYDACCVLRCNMQHYHVLQPLRLIACCAERLRIMANYTMLGRCRQSLHRGATPLLCGPGYEMQKITLEMAFSQRGLWL